MLLSPSSAQVPAFVSSIVHKTMLVIDEEGAIAAAASGEIAETGRGLPPQLILS